ncbi:MAG: hypothetical protein WC592_05345 [Candidatus Omnitrophota bacterium]
MTIITLPFRVRRPILACGADLKGTFALVKGDKAFLVDGFGDLADPDNLARYERSIAFNIKKLKIKPAIVACDMHPGYSSTRFAENLQLKTYNLKLFKIQHHEAHIASVITEHSISGDVIGVAFDGTGFGLDGNIWGGEFFVGGLKKFTRAAHLEYVPMPGGEAAIREPWRMALSWLYRALGEKSSSLKIDLVRKLDKKRSAMLRKMMERGINSPLTSSMGRLLDAAASLVFVKMDAAKEAELPTRFERIVSPLCRDKYKFDMKSERGILIVKASRTIAGVVRDLAKGVDEAIISAKFHNTIADIVLKVSIKLNKIHKIRKVVLSGGVFQNKFLITRAVEALEGVGFDVYTNYRTSTGDPGIPIGQIAIANVRARCV